MEGATDHFAHHLVSSLAQQIAYSLTEYRSRDLYRTPGPNPINDYIYRDCTGQLTSMDMLFLREIEQGKRMLPVPEHFNVYLKNMRLFVQYVNLRYQQFLNDFDPQGVYQLHEIILVCMLSGDIERLQHLFNTILQRTDGFTSLFQSSIYPLLAMGMQQK